MPGGGDGLVRARHELVAAREQLEETLQELAADHRADVALTDRVAIMTPPALVRAGDWARVDLALGTIERVGGRTEHTADRPARPEAFEVAARFDAVADGLEDLQDPVTPLPASRPTTPPAADGLEPAEFLRLVWLWSWLTTVDQSLQATAADTMATVRALPTRWWR